MYGRIFTVGLVASAQTAAKDLVRLSASATSIIVLIRAEWTQITKTTNEHLRISLYRASDAGTGTAVTARPHDVGDTAFGGSAVNNLTVDTTKSPAEALHTAVVSCLSGYLYHPVPEERIVIPPSGRLVLRLETAPAASMTMTALLTFAEIG